MHNPVSSNLEMVMKIQHSGQRLKVHTYPKLMEHAITPETAPMVSELRVKPFLLKINKMSVLGKCEM